MLVFGVSVFAGCIQFEEQTATDSLAPLSPEPHQGAEVDATPENRSDPENAYNDSEPRYHNVVDGQENSKRTFGVPLGTDTLRVALTHDSESGRSPSDEVRFRVQSPLLQTVGDDRTKRSSEKYMDEPDWVVIHDPLPGDWTVLMDIDGASSYTIGVYLE